VARKKAEDNGAVAEELEGMEQTEQQDAMVANPLAVSIPRPDRGVLYLRLVGESPIIVHRFDEKAQGMILDKQTKKAAKGREAKNPVEDFRRSLYCMDDLPWEDPAKRFGFPAVAFKAAAVSACTQVAKLTKTFVRGSFHVYGDPATGLVEIVSPSGPRMRQDMVRIGGMAKTADVRFRGEFFPWSVVLSIHFNRQAMSPEQIAALYDTAGFSVGIGEWRPEKNGQHGMFRVATAADVEPMAATQVPTGEGS
jgi:hypothetical protein